MARPKWKLTVRKGSEVTHGGYDDLDEAVTAMRELALGIRSEGPLRKATMIREYAPGSQVKARLEITGRGFLSKPAAGVDVRGDGAFVPYRSAGLGRREELDPTHHDTPFDLVRETLASSER